MINNVDIQRFLQLFKGKSNTYVKNSLPKEKPSEGQKIKTNIINVEGNVDRELIEQHLEGSFAVGICPVDAEGKCYFGVIDIDYYKTEIKRVLYFIKEHQLPLLPFRSKSGGLHLYLMLSKSVTAKKMREVLNKINYFFCLESIYGKGKVEIFPKQDRAEGFGSSVTLPYFNADESYTYLYDLEGNKIEFKDALSYIQNKLTTLDKIEEVFTHLPYSDAPPCIQRILLSEEVGDEDSGRNNFLFSFAVYAKKKYGNGFEDFVKEVNENFKSSLPESVVEQICSSVKNNEYVYKCKDIPCNQFCNKPECRKREFGLGRDKSHFTGIDYGQLFRYKSAEPYYIWKLRLIGQQEWTDVMFKDEGYLLDQKNFAKLCVRYLNTAPMQVSNNDWYAVLNSILPNIQDIAVSEDTDTSALSTLKSAFISYLANKQANRDCPYQIRIGLCVYQNGKYFFMHRGFYDYLRSQKISFEMGTMRETLKSFGAKEDILTYENALGEMINLHCWSKEDDDELKDAYAGAMEVENGDKARIGISEVSVRDTEEQSENEKPYTEEDMKMAEEMF